jgi:PAS domain S-box-containing protein
MKRMKTISKQILLSLMGTLIVVLGIWGYLESMRTMRHEQEKLRHDQQTIAERVAYNLVYPLWNLNRAEVEKTIQYEAVEEVVRAILVYDDNGDFYSGTIRDESGHLNAYDNNRPQHRHLLSLSVGSKTQEILKNGKLIGKVTVFVDDEHLKSVRQQQRLLLFFTLFALIIAIAGVMFFALRKVVIQPLNLLKEWVLSIGSGQPPSLPQMIHCEEIDVLAASFSEMAVRLTRSKEELEINNRLLRSILDNTFQLQGLLSPDGKLLDVNETALQMINASKELVLGRNFWDTPWWSHTPALSERVRQAIVSAAMGEFVRFEGVHIDASGELHDIDVSMKPVSDDAGNIIYLISEGRDITERRRAEETLKESETKFRAMFEGSRDAINVSKKGVQVFANPAFLKLYGYKSNEEIAGTSVLDHIAPSHRQQILQNIKRRADGEMDATIYETRGRKTDGSEFDIEVSVSNYELNGEIYSLAVIRDITERKRAEEALRQAETRYRTLFESAQDAIFLMQEERFVECNPPTLRMFGCRREQIIGETAIRFSPAQQPDGRDSAGKAREKIHAALSGDPQRFEWRHCRLDGKEFDAEISLNRLEIDAQPMLLAIVRDITERKEAAEALRAVVKATAGSGEDFFRALVVELAKVLHVKYAFVGALLPGAPERVRTVAMWAKDALASNFEYELAKAPCANVINRIPCYYPDNVQLQFPEDKSLVDMGAVSYMGVPLFDATGAALGLLAVLNDRPMESSELALSLLTILANRAATEMERQQREKEIRRLLAQVQEDATELEKRVAERTVQLKVANAQLEAFAYSVSHDLKAPLRGIDGYSRLLLENYAPKLEEEGRSFVHTIRKATAQMALLIDDLLAYSRLERRTMTASPIQLNAFVEALLANYSAEVQSRGVTLNVSVPETTVQADRDGMAMALRNLIENALKFTRNIQAPAIEIGGREEEHSCVLWVRDNGIGFDMQYHDRIFEIFQRLQRAEEYPGTGIGLAMVRKSMERMGGRVWAESKPGEGAAFYLEVPR